MKFNGYTLVWGKNFIDRFLNLSAPTWMSEGNLPYFSSQFEYEHVVLTLRDDWSKIIDSEMGQRMKSLFSVRPFFVDDIRLGFRTIKEKYSVLESIQKVALQDCYDSGADGFVDLYPDTVWSDGLCVSIVKQLNQGKRIYFTKPIRVWEDGVLQHLNVERLTPRYLVRISIDNLHPDWSYYEIDSGHHGDDEKCIWRVGEKGLVVKTFQPSPMVFVPDSRENLQNAIGGNGMTDSVLHVIACPDPSTYYFQLDSDEGVVIEPIEWSEIPKIWKEGTKMDHYAGFMRYALSHERSHHQIYRLEKSFLFHFEDLDESWEPVIQEADRFVREAVGQL